MGLCQCTRQELGLGHGRLPGHCGAGPTSTDVGVCRHEPRARTRHRRRQHESSFARLEKGSTTYRFARQRDATQPGARQLRGHGDTREKLEARTARPRPWLRQGGRLDSGVWEEGVHGRLRGCVVRPEAEEVCRHPDAA